MKISLLIILLAGQPPQVYLSEDCNADIRMASVLMPDADLHCIYATELMHEPEWSMRPVARPEGLGS